MITHDFHRPIPSGTVWISVILGGDSFTVDLASSRLGDTINAFEDHCGLLSADRCMAVAAAAAGDGDNHLVTSAGLWLFLFRPGHECVVNAGRLGEMIASNGSALLMTAVCEKSGEWSHRLFAMPRWPAVVTPYRAIQ